MNVIKSDIIPLYGVANSMQGGRPENQDDFGFLDTPLGFLLVICDGMGGGPGGKTASYMAKCEIANALCECNPQTPREHAFRMAVSRANDALEKKMQDIPSLKGMGSTFVAILISKESACVAHAGDSRCYQIRGGKCIFRSQDHSLVGELVRKKALTEEEARLSPQSNVISRGLGSTTNHVPEIDELPYNEGDRFVLCTDGVWGVMPHEKLIKRFSQKTDMRHIVSNLSTEIDRIGFSHGGHHDNHTVAMLETCTDSLLRPKSDWKKIAIICSASCLLLTVIACVVILVSRKHVSTEVSLADTPSSDICQDNAGGSGFSVSSASDTNETASSETADSASNKAGLSNTDTIMKKLNDVIHNKTGQASGQKPDSVSKKTAGQPSGNPSEITQKVMNRYNSAKKVEGATVADAQKNLEELRKEIKSLMKELRKQCENSKVLPTVEAIDRVVDDQASWYVSREKDKATDKYKPTPNAQKLMDKQIKRLTDLKNKL